MIGTAGSMMGTLETTIGKESLRKMEHEMMLTSMIEKQKERTGR